MHRPFACLFCCLAAFLNPALVATALASNQEWKDPQGNSFKGDPSEVLGPLGLFQTSHTSGRMLPWRALSAGDCVRFYEVTRNKPARADDWALAKSVISQEIAGRVMRLQGDRLVEDDLKGRPEPEFLIVFFADNDIGKSWEMLGHSISPFTRLQEAFPGQVEGLFYGLRHSAALHKSMAVSSKLPWLVADYHDEKRMERITGFVPPEDGSFSMVVVNRDGVPVFSANNPEEAAIDKLFAYLKGLLELMRPANPHSWPDRTYYLRAVQPVAFANGHADPVLVGNPLVPEGLKKNNILQVDASIEVDANGKVTDVALKSDGIANQSMIAPLNEALKKACVFVPAVENGKFVAGTYPYHLVVPR